MLHVKEEDEVILNQQLFFQEKGKQIVAADLKYSYMAGKMANFKPRSELMTSVLKTVRPKN